MKIVYCSECKNIMGAGAVESSVHRHSNDMEYPCVLIDRDEPNYTGIGQMNTADGTVINSTGEWLEYLKNKYVLTI